MTKLIKILNMLYYALLITVLILMILSMTIVKLDNDLEICFSFMIISLIVKVIIVCLQKK